MSSTAVFSHPESSELSPHERCFEQQDLCMLDGILFGSKEYSHGYLDAYPGESSEGAFGGLLVEAALQNNGTY